MKPALPEGRLARAGVAGKAALKVGLGHLGHGLKRPFLSPTQRAEERIALDERHARMLFEALAQLRGTALKAAQMLAMEVELLPEAYRRELEKSCHQVPPLNRVLVRKALQQAFGQAPEALFAQFDSEAFAAASLGQVHRARLHDGRAVAVKIQYPGIHVAVDSDMTLLRQLARGMPNAALIQQSLEEVHARLREEVNYRAEAAQTAWFAERAVGDGIALVSPVPELCGERVLTTEMADGLHLDAWLAGQPSQAARYRAGQQLYDFFVDSTRRLHRLHADPNPGNYLFHPDGSVTVIDFGCVREISPVFAEALPQLLQAYAADDPTALFATYRRLGMEHRGDHDQVYRDILRPFGSWLLEPMQAESYDFATHADYTWRGQQLMHKMSGLKGLDRLADEFIYVDRTYYGLCKLFERLGARVRIRHHWFAGESGALAASAVV
ncbi:MAG: AarF/ABC1/UbiB kinase family protein [Rhodocyclaceae bacterium]|nr:MAG: AarF/ABC1/UbiB kinase family protein [Rhodocyclaceae bacterium]